MEPPSLGAVASVRGCLDQLQLITYAIGVLAVGGAVHHRTGRTGLEDVNLQIHKLRNVHNEEV